MGNPCIEVGDSIKIETRLGTFYTYVLERSLTGSQRLKDTITAKGNEKKQNEHTLYDSVIELKGKSNILTRNIDMTRNEIIDMGENLSSLIEQTAESIKMEVSREVKNTEDNVIDKYQSAVKYTDDQISQTVSRTMYNADKEELQQWRSGIEINYNSISAEVSNSVKSTGGKTGFRWRLIETGWILEACGQYTKITDNPAENQIAVADPTGYNPAQEEWHELVSTNPNVYELTIDQTPQAGKTYYKSQKDPSELHWLETKNGTFELTQDHNIKTSKTYYIQEGSSTWSPVFTANANGVEIPGYINTKQLDVRGLATIAMLQATEAEIDNLTAGTLRIKNDLTALTGNFNTLNTQAIKTTDMSAIRINASQIVSGKISADRLDVEAMFANKWIGVSGISSSGITNTGTVTSKKFRATNDRSEAVLSANTPWNTVADLKVCQMQVSTPSGNKTIYYLGYNP